MMQSIYTAATGLSSQQERLNTIANNIANVQTSGFKASRVDFKDLLYRQMLSPLDGSDTDLMLGTGSAVLQSTRRYSIGSINQTDRVLDAMLMTDGFFAVQNPDGGMMYTRDGNFMLSTVDGTDYLVTKQGYFVADVNGNRIPMDGDLSEILITPEGLVSTGGGAQSQLQVVTFSNKAGLESIGGNYFVPGVNAGEMTAAQGVEIQQGFLEGSNVDMAEEFSRLIRTQRAYQMASRALTVADSMMATATGIRT